MNDHDPTTLPINGRGRLTATATACDGTVTVRLDDRRDDSWWGELPLDLQTLRRLVALAEDSLAEITL